jgi:hypothetical protein
MGVSQPRIPLSSVFQPRESARGSVTSTINATGANSGTTTATNNNNNNSNNNSSNNGNNNISSPCQSIDDVPTIASPEPPTAASISRPMLGSTTSGQLHDSGSGFILSVLSSKKVNRHQFFMIGVSKSNQKEWTIIPRRLADFRDLHSSLVKQFGESVVPTFPQKKATEKEQGASLQEFLQQAMAVESLRESKTISNFLNPLDNPSAYCASEVLVASKKGTMQVMVSRVWKPHFSVLCNSLYFYRSEEDTVPAGVLSLEYVTIEIVRDHKEVGKE